jgi:hypothetical protein
MINVNLPNGQKLQFPDDTSQEEMRSAIARNFPQYDMQAVRAARNEEGKSATQDMPLEEMKRISNIPKQQNRPMPGPGRSPLEYQESPEESGRNIGNERMLKGIKQYAPELIASALVPEVPVLGALSKIPGLAKALQSSPRLAKYAQSIFGNALSQGGVAAAFNPSTAKESAAISGGITAPFSGLSELAMSQNPKAKLAGKLGLGLGGAALGYGASQMLPEGFSTAGIVPGVLGGALLGYRGGPTNILREDIQKGIQGTGHEATTEAAKRLGLPYVTPAEASGNPFLGAQQGALGRTPEGAQKLYQKGQERLQGESKSIENLLSDVFNPKTDASKKKALYQEAYEKKLPLGFINKLDQNEVIKNAKSFVSKDPVYKEELKGLDKNSFEYWDLIKRRLDDMGTESSVKGSRYKPSLIDKTKKKLISEMDKIAPESYPQARYLHEREKAREGIEKAFDKKSMTGTNMYKTLESKKGFEDLMKNLRGVPKAQEQLKDMKLVFKNLINNPTAKTANNLSRNSSNKLDINVKDVMGSLKEALTLGKYDKAAVDLITNPEWGKELAELAKASPTQKNISKAIDMFGKALAQNQAKDVLDIKYKYNQPQTDPNQDVEQAGSY